MVKNCDFSWDIPQVNAGKITDHALFADDWEYFPNAKSNAWGIYRVYVHRHMYIYIHNIQYLIGESKSIVFVNQDVHCIYYSPIFLLEYQSLGMLNVGMLPTHVGILKIGNVCPISDYSIIKMDALFASWRMFQSYTSILRCSGHPTH